MNNQSDNNSSKPSILSYISKGMILCAIALILVAIIFFFSEQTGGQSHTTSRQVATYIANDWNDLFSLKLDEYSLSLLIKILDGPIRKLAHVIEYLLLGFGVYGTIYLISNKKSKLLHVILTLVLVIIVASVDEINQFYSVGRGSTVKDVIIDTIGGSIGIYLVIIIKDFITHIKNIFCKDH